MLNERQERFCRHYVAEGNATKAVILSGYSEKGADVQGSVLLGNPKIKARISDLQDAASVREALTTDELTREYKRLISSNIIDFLDENNQIKDISQLPRELTSCIESIKVTSTPTKEGEIKSVSFKLHNKLAALSDVGKHLGFFEKDNKQKKVTIKVNAPK